MTDTERLNWLENKAYIEPASWGYYDAHYQLRFDLKGKTMRETIDAHMEDE